MATITEYLNKKVANRNDSVAEERFTQYLVAACWQKMARRTHHWSFFGLVYHLHRLLEYIKLKDPIDHTASDEHLARSIRSAGPGLTKIMKLSGSPNYTAGKSPVFPNLVDASNRPECILYTKDTFFEFHQLLVGTTITYAFYLHKMYSKRTYDPRYAFSVYLFGRLLTAIVKSAAFRTHISYIITDLNLIPKHEERTRYLEFAKEHGLIGRGASGNKGASGDENAAVDEEEEIIEDELEVQLEGRQFDTIMALFRLQIKYFTSKSRLDSACTSLAHIGGEAVQNPWGIDLIGAGLDSDPGISWKDLEDELRTFLPSTGLDETLGSLKAKINETKSPVAIIRKVSGLIADPSINVRFGTLHCEAILMIFLCTTHDDEALENFKLVCPFHPKSKHYNECIII